MKHKNSGIRNVQLVSVTDPLYLSNQAQYKEVKEVDVVYNKPVRHKSEIMGYLLEMTIRSWVKNSGISLNERVITYKHGSGVREKNLVRELDYVLGNEKKCIVGEVKVSSTGKGVVSKACAQLIYSKELLENIIDSVTMQIIRIDLNFNNATEPFDEFNNDFIKSCFRAYEFKDHKFQLLYLSAQDVFNYGVRNNIIQSPEIFDPMVSETNLLNNKRLLKVELKERKKALCEIDDFDQIKNIEKSISQIEEEIFLNNIKINLSQQGWAHLENRNEKDYNLIMDYLGNNIKQEIQSDDYCERTTGFLTEDQKIKYISFYSLNAEVEINLLDAEQVHLKLPLEQRTELQNILFVSKSQALAEPVCYPLLIKIPYRKFYYSNNFLRNEDRESISLKQFEHVVNKSEPTKIQLKQNDILIIDNHRMLHRYNELLTGNIRKRKVTES